MRFYPFIKRQTEFDCANALGIDSGLKDSRLVKSNTTLPGLRQLGKTKKKYVGRFVWILQQVKKNIYRKEHQLN